MKKITKHLNLLIVSILFTGFACMTQSNVVPESDKNNREMKTYVIERDIPGVGQFSAEKLKAISVSSCTVLKEIGPSIQ